MRWRLVALALVALSASACVTGGPVLVRTSNITRVELTGPRVTIEPGDQVEIPFRLNAPEGPTELRLQMEIVSDGQDQVPVWAQLSPGGEVATAAFINGGALCSSTCQGDQTLVLSVPSNADHAATVDWTIFADALNLDDPDTWLEAGAMPDPSPWTVRYRSDDRLYDPTADRGLRLHVTAPENPTGRLRLEFPSSPEIPGSAPIEVDVGGSLAHPLVGSSLEMEPQGTCVDGRCDWSMEVIARGPWQVSATTAEFDVSAELATEAVLYGAEVWQERVGAGDVREFTLEASTPTPSHPAGMGLFFRYTTRPTGQPVVITLDEGTGFVDGGTHDLDFSCDREVCRTSIRIRIDATAADDNVLVDLHPTVWMVMTEPSPDEAAVSGRYTQIELKLK